MFDAPQYFCLQANCDHLFTQLSTDAFNIGTPLFALHLGVALNPKILVGLQNLKRQILQLTLDTRHTQPSSQRCVDIASLLCYRQHLLLVKGKERRMVQMLCYNAHCVQMVSKLEQHYTRIFHCTDKHSTYGLCLLEP